MELFWSMAILLALPISIGGAVFMDKRLHEKNPDCLPYKWGFYNGLFGFLISAIFSVIFFIDAADSYNQKADEYAAFGLLSMLIAAASAGFIIRNRWWTIAAIFFQFNPLLWIINGIYLRNRWHEMSGIPAFSVSNFFNSKSIAFRVLTAGSIFWIMVSLAFVVLFEPYGWRIDWGHFVKVLLFPIVASVGGYVLYKFFIAEK